MLIFLGLASVLLVIAAMPDEPLEEPHAKAE